MNNTSAEKRLLFKSGNYYYPFLENKILYLAADGAYTNVHLKNRKISISKSLREVVKHLSQPCFFRIHHSVVINLNYMVRFSSFEGDLVEMSDGQYLSVSKRRRKELLECFHRL